MRRAERKAAREAAQRLEAAKPTLPQGVVSVAAVFVGFSPDAAKRLAVRFGKVAPKMTWEEQLAFLRSVLDADEGER